MAKKTKLMKSKERLSRSEAADFLRQLADKVEAGTVSLIMGADETALEIPPQVTLEVEADHKPKRRGTQYSLEVEIEWRVGLDGETQSGLELG